MENGIQNGAGDGDMKIIYKYSDHMEQETKEYVGLCQFLEDHPLYSQLLSEGREKFNQKIILSVSDLPFTETVEVKQDDETV